MSSVLPKGVPLTSLAVDASARFCDADCTADARETLRALGLIEGGRAEPVAVPQAAPVSGALAAAFARARAA